MDNVLRHNMFTPNSDTKIIGRIVSDMSNTPPEVAIGSVETKGGYFDCSNNILNLLQEISAPIESICRVVI